MCVKQHMTKTQGARVANKLNKQWNPRLTEKAANEQTEAMKGAAKHIQLCSQRGTLHKLQL